MFYFLSYPIPLTFGQHPYILFLLNFPQFNRVEKQSIKIFFLYVIYTRISDLNQDHTLSVLTLFHFYHNPIHQSYIFLLLLPFSLFNRWFSSVCSMKCEGNHLLSFFLYFFLHLSSPWTSYFFKYQTWKKLCIKKVSLHSLNISIFLLFIDLDILSQFFSILLWLIVKFLKLYCVRLLLNS